MTEQTETQHLKVYQAFDELDEDDCVSIAVTELASILFQYNDDEFELRLDCIIDAIREAHAMTVTETDCAELQ